MHFQKPNAWAFQQSLVATQSGRDLWQGCVLAMPFWDYKLHGTEDLSGNGYHGVFGSGIDPIADWDISTYGANIDLEAAANEEITVAAPLSASLDGTTKLSVEMIFRCDSVTAGSGIIQGLMGKYTTTVDRRAWRVYVIGDEVALQVSSDGAGNEIQETTNANLGNGVWAHIVLTFDGGVFRVYKDGVALTTDGNFGTHTSIFAGILEPLRIGSRSDSNRLAGGISGCRIWNGRVLSPETVLRLYQDPWEMYEPPFLPSLALEHSGGAAAGPWIKVADVPKGFQAYMIEGLSNGVSYDVQLKSVDDSGNISAGSTPVAGTPAVGAVNTRLRSILIPRQATSRPPRHLLAKTGRT